MKFGKLMRLDPFNPIPNNISRFRKCKMAAAAILKIRKITKSHAIPAYCSFIDPERMKG